MELFGRRILLGMRRSYLPTWTGEGRIGKGPEAAIAGGSPSGGKLSGGRPRTQFGLAELMVEGLRLRLAHS